MKKTDASHYYILLWQLFESHIEKKWATPYIEKEGRSAFVFEDKYGPFTSLKKMYNAGQKMEFLYHLQKVIQLELLAMDTKLKAPSTDTLARAVTGSFSNQPKEKTISPFLTILGYDSFEGFMNANPLSNALLPTNNDGETENYAEDLAPIAPKRKRLVYIAAALCTLAIAFVIYFVNAKKNNYDNYIYSEFERLIKQSNQYQLDAYRKLPQIDTSLVDRYYTKSSVAKGQFISVLLNSNADGRVLWTEVSSFNIIRLFDIFKINDTKYRAKVEETWFIKWLDAKSLKPVSKYDTTNIQTYIFEKEYGDWKIAVNDFVGKAVPINQ